MGVVRLVLLKGLVLMIVERLVGFKGDREIC